jgi:serine/threonine protein kinase
MSPEQVEGKDLDGSDLFSFGAVLYEMVTGKRAFEGKSQLSVVSAILEREPPPIASIKPTTPPVLDHAIKKCLAKLPEERWQSASDLASELGWIASAGSPTGVTPPAVLRRKVRERLAWALAAALLAVLAFWFLRPSNVPPALPTYASIVPPPGSSFRIEGDLGAPPALSPDGSAVVFGAG